MHSHSTTNSTVLCPRCGYDQRGVLAAWVESCPVSGTCTECGLELEWCELLNPQLTIPAWSVEHKPPTVVAPRQAWGTLRRSFRPQAIWRRVKMTHACRWWRLVTYLAILFAVAYVVMAVGTGVESARDYRAMVAFGRSTLNDSPWAVGVHAAITPLSFRSGGSFTNRRGRTFGSTVPAYHTLELRYDSLATSAMVLAAHVITALAFAALPISRRRAKVRWRHVARVTLYGVGVLVAAYVVNAIAFMIDADRSFLRQLGWLTLLAILIWEIAWWKAAVTRYLRMEHGWAVSLSVVAIGVVASITLMGSLYFYLDVRPPIS